MTRKEFSEGWRDDPRDVVGLLDVCRKGMESEETSVSFDFVQGRSYPLQSLFSTGTSPTSVFRFFSNIFGHSGSRFGGFTFDFSHYDWSVTSDFQTQGSHKYPTTGVGVPLL